MEEKLIEELKKLCDKVTDYQGDSMEEFTCLLSEASGGCKLLIEAEINEDYVLQLMTSMLLLSMPVVIRLSEVN